LRHPEQEKAWNGLVNDLPLAANEGRVNEVERAAVIAHVTREEKGRTCIIETCLGHTRLISSREQIEMKQVWSLRYGMMDLTNWWTTNDVPQPWTG
jgi:hypothetical protein